MTLAHCKICNQMTNHSGYECLKCKARTDEVIATAELAKSPLNTKLKYLTTISLEATTGKETIAQSRDVFTIWLSHDFKDWGLDKESKPTRAVKVDVLEMQEDATFMEIFSSLGSLDSLALTQGQIIEFCKNYRDIIGQNDLATFFLFKVDCDYFVAGVSVIDHYLKADLFRLNNDCLWHAEHHRRVVVLHMPDRTNKQPCDEKFEQYRRDSDPAIGISDEQADWVKSFIRQVEQEAYERGSREAIEAHHHYHQRVRTSAIQECIDLSDTIEGQYSHTEHNEWRAFKGFRNTMRDIIDKIKE